MYVTLNLWEVLGLCRCSDYYKIIWSSKVFKLFHVLR